MSPASKPAGSGAVAGLARELEAVGEVVETLKDVPRRVTELGAVVAQLAKDVAALSRPAVSERPVSWLALPPDGQPSAHLADLCGWMSRVYLRYPDAVLHLPGCWLWHPDVVEELLWLRLVWAVAYHPETGSPAQSGDWHERYRPGVVRRIRERAGTCSLELHQDADRGAGPEVPLAEASELIAAWWADGRHLAGPVPTEAHLAAADRHLRRSRAGRR